MKNNLIFLCIVAAILLLYYYLTLPEPVVIEQEPEVVVTEKAPRKVQRERKIPSDFVLVKGGSFMMGGSERDNEKPVHRVTISDFYIGKYEVTQAQWRSVTGKNPSFRKGDSNPVENISWFDAVAYCNKLSELSGLAKCYTEDGDKVTCDFSANGYRLPTEAEWEYAATGGITEGSVTDYTYSGSNKVNEVAWHRSNSGMASHPAGGKKPNEIGIYDMSGNVWEWVWDNYGENYYSASPENNPRGPEQGHERVIRGGSWGGDSKDCRNAYRKGENPHFAHRFYGLRVVRLP
jgi:formylglycine-generating enzyme